MGAASRAGFAIRVAVISSAYDLRSITALWRKPRIYARFLGLELSLAATQRLLVVMPNGFGFDWPGHPAGSAYGLLANVPVEPGGAGLAGAAQTAVRRLAAAAGVPLPERTGRTVAARSDGLIVIVATVAAALAVAVLVAVRRRRRAPLVVVSERSIASRASPVPFAGRFRASRSCVASPPPRRSSL